MAQAEATRAPVSAANSPVGFTDKEAYEIQQYEKIVQLRDAILSGTHRFIKPPDTQGALAQSFLGSASTAAHAGVNDSHHRGLQSSTTKAKNPGLGAVAIADGGSAPAPPVNPQPLGAGRAGRAGINPILLEKSIELVRAELALQRQRLERALRDEVEQRRVSKLPQGERYSDLDLSDVLDKALTLVPPVAAPTPADEDLTANNEAASDSFDDNTFYSSQHGTPHSHMTSRIRDGSEEALGSNASHQNPASAPKPADETRDQRAQGVTDPRIAGSARLHESHHDLSTGSTGPLLLASIVPGLNNYIEAGNVSTRPSQNITSGEPSQSEDSGNMEYEPSGAGPAPNSAQQQSASYADNHPPSPLVRGHTLQPVAPQPAQISPLAVSRRGQDAVNPAVQRTRGTPAQVAALRNKTSAVTSPDSSSQGGRGSDRKKSKRKKRKADRQAPEIDATPYIKPEPRSPSPLTAPSYKRQRHSQSQVIELEYEPRYERPLALGPDAQYLTRPFRDERVPLGYEGSGAYPQRAASTTVVNDLRYVREYIDDRRIAGDGRYALPGAVPLPYSPSVAYSTRPVSQAFASDGYREPPRPYREYPEGGRVSVRPDGDSFTGPPKPAPPTRVVDAFGREYFDPSHPAAQRPTAPSIAPGEPGVVYERLPPRAVSRHAGSEPYGDGGVVYGGPAAPYAMPKRILTQPEYASYDYRDGPPREYSERPMAQPGSFIEVRGPQERRYMDQAPRGYAARAASMLPVEAVRYEVPQGYGRVQSVRPEAPGREYAASVHPEMRREAMQPYAREYAAPMEQYHQPQARGADEIAFIERPRGATQEIVYADDVRREVYR
ncbi:hypothetical protein TOPH_02337 [Tolypocladium ophioglossoides CBS 100239]|uniref:Uncharacterized protein n=1 Tax=Tolypocladium ophioglossoides (strain CBS 100239) TaxID=1163406 RepID=A0A0L0NHY8_TOLOC|nr:hypothetical protein TOPH_02337 [Tolypocladium ophioglossoides CBS 100239]